MMLVLRPLLAGLSERPETTAHSPGWGREKVLGKEQLLIILSLLQAHSQHSSPGGKLPKGFQFTASRRMPEAFVVERPEPYRGLENHWIHVSLGSNS